MNEAGNEAGSVTVALPSHTGPICLGCGEAFYYDYIPERHDGSGYCWICFDERNPRMTNDFDLAATRSSLTKLRKQHGADTPIGHRCSNLLEQLEIMAQATDPDLRRRMEKAVGQSVAELSSLISKGNRGGEV